MIRHLLAFFLLFVAVQLSAQDISMKRTVTPIIIDGEIDEVWNTADSAYNFMQFFPMDTSFAESSTVAKILYDDQNLYILGIMQNLGADRTYLVPSLRRDFFGQAVDSFTILIDAFQDNTNAFMFGISPFGLRREGLIVN